MNTKTTTKTKKKRRELQRNMMVPVILSHVAIKQRTAITDLIHSTEFSFDIFLWFVICRAIILTDIFNRYVSHALHVSVNADVMRFYGFRFVMIIIFCFVLFVHA